ncbi:MAG TPA: multidrug efflux RND transporter permease subunit [Burkholderiaceae bacterium]|nr:multidrug efflux RND transporter permease subunit [Burkholderiaceae bacterium]
MSLSSPFIVRPVATTLLTAAIALAGALGYTSLPVAPLPQMDFPTISVQASLPGASPDTMAATVAAPLERSLGVISGVNEMTSNSSLGQTRINLQFDLSRDIDGAARDVQAAINAARPLLPSGLPSNPTYHKSNPSDAPIMILTLTSDALTRGQMYDVASTVLAQRISQVTGVGQVDVSGGALPAVRVELNIAALNRAGISLETVRAAIAATNSNRPKGMLDDAEQTWQVGANDQARTADEYLPLIVAYRNGAPVRLADVASVQDSVENVRNLALSNGKPAILIFVRRQPGANILATVERVRTLLPVLRASIPAAIDMRVMMERTPTIRASLKETERTLIIAVALVIFVVFLFLRDPRAALIPAVAVPVSLIGTFAAMYLFGFSLNNLTLMALTISTGFVVDDAIVVLENITRHVERGVAPMQAALLGAREIGFTVLSMSLSLIAVFVPILAMGGFLGRLFREFAVTLSVAILISLVVSLTTTPMMCARLLRHRQRPAAASAPSRWRRGVGSAAGGFWNAVTRIGSTTAQGYERSVVVALRHPVITLLVLFITIAANVFLFIRIPKGLFPTQETGLIMGGIQADQSTSFQSMSKKLQEFLDVCLTDPAVVAANGFTGGGSTNSGFVFLVLKPISESHATSDQIIARLRGKLAHVAGANLFLQPVQDLRMGARQSNSLYQYTLTDADVNELRDWEPRIRGALSQLPELADVNTDSQDKGLRTSLKVDRNAVDRLNLTMNLVDSTLNDAFGQRQVSTIYEPLNQYHVVMEAAPRYWQQPTSLNDVYVVTPSGGQVPLAALATWQMSTTPLAVNHQGLLAASTISFNLAPGVSLGQATTAINRAMARIGVPSSIQGGFQGSAKLFLQSLSSEPLLILAALVTIYIVLGILYESTLHPITILSTLPSAGVGAVLALQAFNTEFTIMAMIGVILLIGIVKKNAIMMIDVAIETSRREGVDSREAIRRACLLRFRPIMMTTLAALFGALPLVVVSGEGAQLRQPLGISIVGGLILSQLLTLYTTPVVYYVLDRARSMIAARRARRVGPQHSEPVHVAADAGKPQ